MRLLCNTVGFTPSGRRSKSELLYLQRKGKKEAVLLDLVEIHCMSLGECLCPVPYRNLVVERIIPSWYSSSTVPPGADLPLAGTVGVLYLKYCVSVFDEFNEHAPKSNFLILNEKNRYSGR